MSAIASNEAPIVAQTQVTDAQYVFSAEEKKLGRGSIDVGKPHAAVDIDDASDITDVEPNEEELQSLRRVSGKIPWQAFTIAFVELCERFSYYGTTIVFGEYFSCRRPPRQHLY
jgi:proton-dependent oligopeptide transporter, POT family